MHQPSFFAIVPAAGSGQRMHAVQPKQYLPLGGKTVLEQTLHQLLGVKYLRNIVVVLAEQDTRWQALDVFQDPRIQTTQGGAQRADSVRQGLQALMAAHAHDWVLVHDAVRPCIQAQAIEQGIDHLKDDAVGGLFAIPVTDTLKQVDQHGRVGKSLDRDALWCAQTPQMFRYALLQEGLIQAQQLALKLTDEASAIEHLGKKPRIIQGEISNIKITYPSDLRLAQHYWEAYQ